MKTNEKEDPCWFGFPVIVRPTAPFSRTQLTEFLENNKIGSRNVFSGNLLRHPAYKVLEYRIYGKIVNADMVMNGAFWLGVYTGIGDKQIDYMKAKISEFISSHTE